MKTNKKLLLTLTLIAACFAQPAQGMNYVNRGLNKTQKHWKPLACGVAIIGLAWYLWSTPTNVPSQEKEVSDAKKYIENIKKLVEKKQRYLDPEYEEEFYSEIIDLPFKALTEKQQSDVLHSNNQELFTWVHENNILSIANIVSNWSKTHNLFQDYTLKKLEKIALAIDKTNDNAKMYALYTSVDTLFAQLSSDDKKNLLSHNNQQLRTDSKNDTHIFRHLAPRIKDWYKQAKIITLTKSMDMDSATFCVLNMSKLNKLAREIDKTDDKQKMNKLYKDFDKIFESMEPNLRKKLLLFNNKELLTKSKNTKSRLRHLGPRIKELYVAEKLYK